jgi:hypothetical protein
MIVDGTEVVFDRLTQLRECALATQGQSTIKDGHEVIEWADPLEFFLHDAGDGCCLPGFCLDLDLCHDLILPRDQ